MGWWLELAFLVVPVAFWWCCCRPPASCTLPCCRSGTAPASGLFTAGTASGIAGFEFIFTSFTTNTGAPLFCTPGLCESTYEGVSIILDYGGWNGLTGECTWGGRGEQTSGGCAELPDVRVSNLTCSSDRKELRFIVGADTSPHTNPETCVITITSAISGDVVCNTIKSGTLSSVWSLFRACSYRGAQFTIQAIPV